YALVATLDGEHHVVVVHVNGLVGARVSGARERAKHPLKDVLPREPDGGGYGHEQHDQKRLRPPAARAAPSGRGEHDEKKRGDERRPRREASQPVSDFESTRG